MDALKGGESVLSKRVAAVTGTVWLWLRAMARSERGAEVPEYVLVVAIIAMLAVGGLVAVKSGLQKNLANISTCLTTAATSSASSCQ